MPSVLSRQWESVNLYSSLFRSHGGTTTTSSGSLRGGDSNTFSQTFTSTERVKIKLLDSSGQKILKFDTRASTLSAWLQLCPLASFHRRLLSGFMASRTPKKRLGRPRGESGAAEGRR
uniref:UBX domain-containing protein n=1 Tax=Steinernema glaseri TaxID=37863 RepID=A0A1I7ZVL5_9BILA